MPFLRKNYHRPEPPPPRFLMVTMRIFMVLGIVLILAAGYCSGPGSHYGGAYRP